MNLPFTEIIMTDKTDQQIAAEQEMARLRRERCVELAVRTGCPPEKVLDLTAKIEAFVLGTSTAAST